MAREQPRKELAALAAGYGAVFAVVECVCSDVDVHRGRVDGRRRDIPGWYELDWERVERGRSLYQPLREPKVVIDAVDPPDQNLARVMGHLAEVGTTTVPAALRRDIDDIIDPEL